MKKIIPHELYFSVSAGIQTLSFKSTFLISRKFLTFPVCFISFCFTFLINEDHTSMWLFLLVYWWCYMKGGSFELLKDILWSCLNCGEPWGCCKRPAGLDLTEVLKATAVCLSKSVANTRVPYYKFYVHYEVLYNLRMLKRQRVRIVSFKPSKYRSTRSYGITLKMEAVL